MNLSLKPGFVRAFSSVAILFVVVSVIAYFQQGYFEHRWWSLSYAESLLIPFTVMVTVIWLAFVPKTLEISDTHFTVQFPFRKRQTFTWEALKYYWYGHNVFCVEFDGPLTFQIFPGAYQKKQWYQFTGFIQNQFPDRRASGWIGPRGFKFGGSK
jgi:hypothetical protein